MSETTTQVIPKDFQPSRKRHLECVVKQAATGNQPSGGALPTLLRGEPQNLEEHRSAALALDPFAVLLERAISTEDKHAIAACAQEPDHVISKRFAAKAMLADVARKLEDKRTTWASELPENSHPRT